MAESNEKHVNIKFVTEVNGEKRTATTDRFKVVYDGKTPEGILTCKVSNQMFPGEDRFFSNTLSLTRDQYGYETIDKVYEHDIVSCLYKGSTYIGIVTLDRSLCLAYISTGNADNPIKIPLYLAKNISALGSTLLGQTVADFEQPNLETEPENLNTAEPFTQNDVVKPAQPVEPERVPMESATNSTGIIALYTKGVSTKAPYGGRMAGGSYIMQRFGSVLEEKNFSLGDITSNRADLIAACNAIESALAQDPQEIKVLTDSQYVVNGAMKWYKAWVRNNWRNKSGDEVKNSDVWMHLLALKEEGNVSFEWIEHAEDVPAAQRSTSLAIQASSGNLI